MPLPQIDFINPSDRVRFRNYKDYMKNLLQGMYLARYLRRVGNIAPDLPIHDPNAPSPFQSNPASRLSEELLFEQLRSALKDSPYPQPSIPALEELRISGEHLKAVDELIEVFESGLKELKTDRKAFLKATKKG